MHFTTPVGVEPFGWRISPSDRLLFVGSCFAASIGQSFIDDGFRAAVNPYGTMYNPASVLHTIERWKGAADAAFITLGTNHIYRLRATGEIVDNCEKRPAKLFQEEELGVEQCADYLRQAIARLRERNAGVRVAITVSPIRYAKYGFHGSRLSKAVLLLAAQTVVGEGLADYFPAYEIVLDELRDYRFYAPDMLHPSAQAAEYIREKLDTALLGTEALEFMSRARAVRAALRHRPLHPESIEARAFAIAAKERLAELRREFPWIADDWGGPRM